MYSDTNECERYSDICGPQQQCMNNDGGHSCVCVMGYEVDPSDPYGRTCQGKYVLALLLKHFPSSATCHRGLPDKCSVEIYGCFNSHVMVLQGQLYYLKVSICYIVLQTLMNASMQLFRVSYCALELRVGVLTRLGHTSVSAPLAPS